MSIVYLNGDYIPIADAKISVLDRGFLFADALYEVIPAYDKKPFRVQEHIERLNNGLRVLQIDIAMQWQDWQHIFDTLLAEQTPGHYQIYLQVTRGASTSRTHDFPELPIKPTIFVQITPLLPWTYERLRVGLSAMTTEDKRRHDCYLKMTGLMPNVLAKQQAKQAGFDEAILINQGIVTEGSTSNVFMVKNKQVFTHPSDHRILGGITRNLILEILQQTDYEIKECAFGLASLLEADEVWISSSTKEVAPIINIDHTKVGSGKVGPVWEKVYHLFQQVKQSYA